MGERPMKPDQELCPPIPLSEMLDERADSLFNDQQLDDLHHHVADCHRCQTRLEKLAAAEDYWDKAPGYLSGSDFHVSPFGVTDNFVCYQDGRARLPSLVEYRTILQLDLAACLRSGCPIPSRNAGTN